MAHGFENPSRPTGDVYLKFTSPVRLDTGRSADRTGGPVRPDVSYVAASRDRGPLGSKALQEVVQKPASEATPQPSAASFFTPESLDARGSADLFDGSSKLFGIMPLGDALKLAVGALGAIPALRETLHYASDVVSDAERSVERMRGVLRDRVLHPCLGAVETLEAQLTAALRPANLTPAVLYPTIWVALEDLRKALGSALDGGAGEAEPSDLFERLGTVYGAGRRFVAAVERVAADPITPVREALREAFTRSVSSLTGIEASKLAAIRDALGHPPSLEAPVKAMLSDAALAGWRRLTFAVPVARQGARYRDVDAAVEVALEAAIKESAWLSGGTVDPRILSDDLARRLRSVAAVHADPAIRQAIDDAVRDWEGLATPDATAVEGLAFGRLRIALRTLEDGVSRVQAVGSTLESVRDALLVGSDRLLRGYLALALGSVGGIVSADLCGQVLSPFLNLLDSLVPAVEVGGGTPCTTLASPVCATAGAFKADDGHPVDPTEVCQAAIALLCDLDALALSADAASPPPPPAVAATARSVRGDLATALEPLAHVLAAVDGLGVAYRRDKVRLQAACAAGAAGLAADAQRALGVAASMQRLRRHLLVALGTAGAALGEATSRLAPLVDAIPSDVALGLTATGRAYATAVRGAAAVGWALLRLAGDTTLLVTALGVADDARRAAFSRLGDELTALSQMPGRVGEIGKAAISARAEATDAVNALAVQVTATRKDLERLANGTIADAAALKADVDALGKVFADPATALGGLNGPLMQKVAAAEAAIGAGLAAGLAVSDATLAVILDHASMAFGPVLEAIDTLYDAVLSKRDKFYADYLADGGPANDPGALVAKAGLRSIGRRFLVARPPEVPPNGPRGDLGAAAPTKPADDFLTSEAAEVKRRRAALQGGPLTPDEARHLAATLQDWAAGRSALQLLATQIIEAGGELMRGSIVALVDLNAARRVVEDQLKSMIPVEAVLTYDLAGVLQPFPSTKAIFVPGPGSTIAVNSVTRLNLLDPGKGPTLSVNGTLGPFKIDLFDIVTLSFSGATFVSGSNRGSDFKLAYESVALGERVAFLKDISSYLQPRDGSGPYVTPLAGRPGVEAGYGLALGVISIGTVSFINVSLNAACHLPFDDSAALFTASIGRRDAPFLISRGALRRRRIPRPRCQRHLHRGLRGLLRVRRGRGVPLRPPGGSRSHHARDLRQATADVGRRGPRHDGRGILLLRRFRPPRVLQHQRVPVRPDAPGPRRRDAGHGDLQLLVLDRHSVGPLRGDRHQVRGTRLQFERVAPRTHPLRVVGERARAGAGDGSDPVRRHHRGRDALPGRRLARLRPLLRSHPRRDARMSTPSQPPITIHKDAASAGGGEGADAPVTTLARVVAAGCSGTGGASVLHMTLVLTPRPHDGTGPAISLRDWPEAVAAAFLRDGRGSAKPALGIDVAPASAGSREPGAPVTITAVRAARTLPDPKALSAYWHRKMGVGPFPWTTLGDVLKAGGPAAGAPAADPAPAPVVSPTGRGDAALLLTLERAKQIARRLLGSGAPTRLVSRPDEVEVSVPTLIRLAAAGEAGEGWGRLAFAAGSRLDGEASPHADVARLHAEAIAAHHARYLAAATPHEAVAVASAAPIPPRASPSTIARGVAAAGGAVDASPLATARKARAEISRLPPADPQNHAEATAFDERWDAAKAARCHPGCPATAVRLAGLSVARPAVQLRRRRRGPAEGPARRLDRASRAGLARIGGLPVPLARTGPTAESGGRADLERGEAAPGR